MTLRRAATIIPILVLGLVGPRLAPAEPIAAGSILVLDGDTVARAGVIYRLVGFDAPEQGRRAKCESEAALAGRATARLRAIIDAGRLDFSRVACACRAMTEGTPLCNYGRLCAVLRSDGEDVAGIMIREGLAHALVCGQTRCPRREPWC